MPTPPSGYDGPTRPRSTATASVEQEHDMPTPPTPLKRVSSFFDGLIAPPTTAPTVAEVQEGHLAAWIGVTSAFNFVAGGLAASAILARHGWTALLSFGAMCVVSCLLYLHVRRYIR